MWQTALRSLWSCNFSTQRSFCPHHSSTSYFIVLDAFHPVLHPGGKERTLAFRFAGFKDPAVEGCISVVSSTFSVSA